MPPTELAPLTPTSVRRRRRNRRIVASLVFLVLLIGCAALAAGLWMRHAMQAGLPRIDGTLQVSGLAGPVSVRRDGHGVPHIEAASEDDLLVAQGYVTAQDRLWQMDMLRRHAAGELAEVLGRSMLEHDRTQRILQLRAVADRSVDALDPGEREALEMYARGVNAAMAAANPLPAEFRLLGYTPQPWTPRDSLLVGFAMSEDLSTTYPEKLNREAVQAHLTTDEIADLYPVTTFRDHPPAEGRKDLTAPREMIEIPLDDSQTRLRSPEHREDLLRASAVLAQSVDALRCEGCAAGSNSWVVSGARSASGKPMLANDMHLSITVPGIWYTADLKAPGLEVAGVTLPGVPYVIVGHNAHVAWGFTNSTADVQDVYVEHAAAVEHRAETIRVKHGMDETLDVALTRHGDTLTPVISPLFPREKRTLALRWTLYERGYASVPFGAANKAAGGDALVGAFAKFGGPSQNLVWADDAGHIGYHLVGEVPLRSVDGTNRLAAVPVAAGTYEWSGFLPYDQLPLVVDPAAGVIATANARITSDSYAYPISQDWESPYRNERIWHMLGDRTGLRAADMTAMQNDTFSALDQTLGQRVAYAVDHAKSPGKRAKEAADLLRGWKGRVTLDAPQPNITQAVRAALVRMVLEPKLGKEGALLYRPLAQAYAMEMLVENAQPAWLPPGYDDWNELLTAALERGLSEAHAPGRLADWRWGKSHAMALGHPVFGSSWYLRMLAGAETWRAPLPGNAYTVRVASGVHSASERFVVDLGDPAGATMTLPMGESGGMRSAWFGDQFASWVKGEALVLEEKAGGHQLTLTP